MIRIREQHKANPLLLVVLRIVTMVDAIGSSAAIDFQDSNTTIDQEKLLFSYFMTRGWLSQKENHYDFFTR